MNWNAPIRWGLIGGLASVILSLLIYFISPSSFATFWIGFVFIALALFFMIWGGLEFRKENNNEITYVQALGATLLIAAIISLISTFFSFILMSYIDPQLPELIKQKAIENTISMMEKFNSPDDKIEEAVNNIKDQNFNFGLKEYAMRFGYGMAFYLVLGLIVSAFIKRNSDKIQTTQE